MNAAPRSPPVGDQAHNRLATRNSTPQVTDGATIRYYSAFVELAAAPF